MNKIKTKTVKMYELAIYFYDGDDEIIETHEYESLEFLTDELKDVLAYFVNYTKMEISIITVEVDDNGNCYDNLDCEPLFTITNERKNKGE